MSGQDMANVWEVVLQHGEMLNKILAAQLQMAQIREDDKQVIEQLGATVELYDARLQMLSAKVDELEATLRGH